MMHDRNTFLYVICAVAFHRSTESGRIRLLINNVQLCLLVIIFCLNISKSVDTGNDLCRILAEAVQDDAERFLADFIRLLRDTDSALSCCEGLMSCQEAETLCLFLQKHLAQVAVSQTYLPVVCYRPGIQKD